MDNNDSCNMAFHTASQTTSGELPIISYAKIVAEDVNELASLRKACEQHGFWYLDLLEDNKEPISAVERVPLVFESVNKFFQMENEEKVKYDVDTIGPWKLNGYTPFGRNAGLAGDGKKHGVEGYTVPRDGISNPLKDGDNLILPSLLQKETSALARFMDQLHGIGLVLLGVLEQFTENSELGRIPLASQHQPSEASTTCLTVQRYPSLSAESPYAGLSAHTDVGSLTILFCAERGLQTLNPHTKQWNYVEPKEGCAIVNVGDSLRFLSNKMFRSVLHRVVPYRDTTIENRFSCAYFIRPKLDSEFKDEEGKRWKSIDWHMRKYKGYRETNKAA